MKKRQLFASVMAGALLLGTLTSCGNSSSSSGDNAEEWPTKAVNVVVTASAGGDTDFNARTFATYFEKVTGQPMVITNTAGGGGSVATSEVKDSKPDGTKILFCHTGQMIVNEVAGLIDQEVKAIVDRAYRQCEEILSRCRRELEITARYLLDHETMEAEVFAKVFDDPGAEEFADYQEA